MAPKCHLGFRCLGIFGSGRRGSGIRLDGFRDLGISVKWGGGFWGLGVLMALGFWSFSVGGWVCTVGFCW